MLAILVEGKIVVAIIMVIWVLVFASNKLMLLCLWCREEFEKVESFAAGLPVDNWVSCKLQMLNRPSAPVLVLISRK